MKKSQYRLIKEESKPMTEEYRALLKEYHLSEVFGTYALNLGLKTKEDFRQFLTPDITDLSDPTELYDLIPAVERIQQAIENQEKILIYGDYDADGITSTTILKEAIEYVGGEALYYLPNRFKDGYGPNLRVYQEFIDFGVQLIITVDNGVSGHEAIAYAKERGVNVIVTDHHELPEVLPDAYAIVHPKHPKGHYPFKDLAGAGVSFKVACGLLGEVSPDLLELAAIGTIADLVPLVGENRTIAKLGLQQMQYTQRVGLHQLFKVAEISFDEINEETIGFQIAPRLNALGRIDDASLGVELLSTFDEEEALTLSQKINQTNETRKQLVEQSTALAFEQVQKEPLSFVLDKSFHEGVMGIIAGKLKQVRQSPAFVLTVSEETGLAKGSARSVEAFPLFENLQKISYLFENFGGHKMAAGFSLKVENVPLFKEEITRLYLEEIEGKDARENLRADLVISSTDEITTFFVNNLLQFAPFGTNHEKPHLYLSDVTIADAKALGKESAHLKFTTSKNGNGLSTIAFQKGAELTELTSGGEVDLVCDAVFNDWNGHRSIQLSLLDYQVKGRQLFDWRKKNWRDILEGDFYYLVWDEKLATRLHLPKEKVITYESTTELDANANYVMVDCPLDLKKAKAFISNYQLTRLYLLGLTTRQAYLNGLPSREVFTSVFKFLKNQKNLDVRYKNAEIAKYLKISKDWFIFIVEVFLELNFVKIEEGVLNPVKNPEPKHLEETQTYQNWMKAMKVEEFLLYSAQSEILNWLNHKEEL